jgi:hypothetical protein
MGLTLFFSAFLLGALRYHARPIIDDAAICFRYVDHIVAGHGIVYNYPGPHVYGASTLPYTLLLSLLHCIGLDTEFASLIVNIVCLAVTCCLLFRLCVARTELVHARMPGLWVLLPCFLALFNGTVMVWITQGLESGFHLLLCVTAIWFYEYRKYTWSGLFIAFALMNKLDAVTLGAAIVLYHTAIHHRLPFRLIGVAIIAYLPWLLFTSLYFGNPLPMSLMAKVLHEFASHGHGFLSHYQALLWVVIPGLASVFLSRAAFVRILGIWFVLYVLLYDFVARGGQFPWYFFPSDFTICFLAGITLAILACGIALPGARVRDSKDRQPVMPSPAWRQRIVSGVAVVLFVWLGLSGLRVARYRLRDARNWSNTIEQDRVDIGLFLHRYAAPTESVYSGHGWIQFLSRLKVYDGSGINDPDLVRMTWEGRQSRYLPERRPTYLVDHAYIPPADLRSEYILIARFTRTERAGWPNWNLWARKDSVAMKALENNRLPIVFPVSGSDRF